MIVTVRIESVIPDSLSCVDHSRDFAPLPTRFGRAARSWWCVLDSAALPRFTDQLPHLRV